MMTALGAGGSYFSASLTISSIKGLSLSGMWATYRWLERRCSIARHTRRSERRKADFTFSTTCCPLAGLAIFPSRILGDGNVQRQIRHQPLQSGIFLLHLSRPLRLVDLYPPIGFPPLVIRLIRYHYCLARSRNGLALADRHFHFPQLADDLFGCKDFISYGLPAFPRVKPFSRFVPNIFPGSGYRRHVPTQY